MTAFCWIATAICLTGTVVNIRRIDWCFIAWIIGEIMWCWFDWHNGFVSRLILDFVGLVLACVGAWENLIRKPQRKNAQ